MSCAVPNRRRSPSLLPPLPKTTPLSTSLKPTHRRIPPSARITDYACTLLQYARPCSPALVAHLRGRPNHFIGCARLCASTTHANAGAARNGGVRRAAQRTVHVHGPTGGSEQGRPPAIGLLQKRAARKKAYAGETERGVVDKGALRRACRRTACRRTSRRKHLRTR